MTLLFPAHVCSTHQFAGLIDDFHFCDASATLLVDAGNRVNYRDRVSEHHGLEKAKSVVAGGDREIGQAFLMDHMRYAECRRGGHVADQQRAMSDPAAKIGPLLHILIVDMRIAEIARDTGEHDDVGFPHGFRKAIGIADLDAIQS